MKTFMLMNNAPGHPNDLEDLMTESPYLAVKFLPSDMKLLSQPIGQELIQVSRNCNVAVEPSRNDVSTCHCQIT